jgi:hypothetical protein
MMIRLLTALLLLAATLTLAPLAQSTTVDPNWGGFYDDADFDDVILAITSAVGVVDSQRRPDPGFGSPVAEHRMAEAPDGLPFFPPRIPQSRAPPDQLLPPA